MSQNRPGTPIPRFRGVLDNLIKNDPVLYPMMGTDEWGNRKVYERLAPNRVEPRYITWALLDGEMPEGTYGDDKALQGIPFQISCWSEEQDDAWRMWEFAEENLDLYDSAPEMDPWRIILIKRLGVADIRDESTGWWHVTGTYSAVLAR